MSQTLHGMSSPSQDTSHPVVAAFGDATHNVVEFYTLPDHTHDIFRVVFTDYSRDEWNVGLAKYLPSIDECIISHLVEAMHLDFPAN